MVSSQIQTVTVQTQYRAEESLAEPDGALNDRVEHRLDVSR